MAKNLYKCCFCLTTAQTPMVMCVHTHVACFDCLCEYISTTEYPITCPECRTPLCTRFDRLVQETCVAFKKRKRPGSRKYEVFMHLLDIKGRNRYKACTRTLRRFVKATPTHEALEQMHQDIVTIQSSFESGQRLVDQNLFDYKAYVMRH